MPQKVNKDISVVQMTPVLNLAVHLSVENKFPSLDLNWIRQMPETVYLCSKQISREKNQLVKEHIHVYATNVNKYMTKALFLNM